MFGGLVYCIPLVSEAMIKAAIAEFESRKLECLKQEEILKGLPESERLNQQNVWDLIDTIRYSSRSRSYTFNNFYKSDWGLF